MVTGDLRARRAAVAAGEVAGPHAGQFERHDSSPSSATIQRMGRMKRGAALAGPVHGLGEVDLEDEAGQRLGQDVDALRPGTFFG